MSTLRMLGIQIIKQALEELNSPRAALALAGS